ncbi:MAG: hypothetical protein GF346_05085 [Candidatus Eisenbacteria bacterium]|nr:hypothetical protein [Candidatus Latescibacterota bacterium]MBD3301800.1 hypothetical protein [Candidatus Eisenbacteria bacterium]
MLAIVVLTVSLGIASIPSAFAIGDAVDQNRCPGGGEGRVLDGPPNGGGAGGDGGDPDEFFLGCVPADPPELISREDRPADRPERPAWNRTARVWWIDLLKWRFWIP